MKLNSLLRTSGFLLGFTFLLAACGGGGGSGGDGGGDGSGGGGGGGGQAQSWTAHLGAENAMTRGRKIARDLNGNLYVAGHSNGDLDGSFGAQEPHYFLAKYTASGQRLFLRQLAAQDPRSVDVRGLATDRDGNVYLLLYLDGHMPSIRVLNPSGEDLGEFSAGIPDATFTVRDLAVDSNGNIFIVGWVQNNSGYPRPWEYFLAKYDPDGQLQFRYRSVAQLASGSPGATFAYSVTVDDYDNVYVAGETIGGLDGNSHIGGSVIHGGGSGQTYFEDGFLVKFNNQGTRLYTRQFGANNSITRVRSMAIDQSGRIFLAGGIVGSFPGQTRYGFSDYFLAHFNVNGQLQSTQQLGAPGGGSVETIAWAVDTDDEGNVYVAGHTNGELDGKKVGVSDAFLAKYDPSVNKVGVKVLGVPNEHTAAYDAVVDPTGNVFALLESTGNFDGHTALGSHDAFVRRESGSWTATNTPDPGSDPGGNPGNDPALSWGSWQFVQTDKAVQFQMALVRVDGSHHIFRIRYRVNSSDPIYHPLSNGYHLYRLTDTGVKYRVEFPSSFKGLDSVYTLPLEIAVYVDGVNVAWDSTTKQLIYHNTAYRPSGYSSCVDDNSSTSRCEGYYGWKRNEVSNQYTASAN